VIACADAAPMTATMAHTGQRRNAGVDNAGEGAQAPRPYRKTYIPETVTRSYECR